jgi:YHS domain-containing protein
MKRIFIFLFLSVVAFAAYPQTDGIRQKNFNTKKNLALEGYDPVSYFDNQPVEGKETLTITHKGITYYFSNATNLSKFKSAPGKYEPAYGGWCAYAMGETGEKVKVDPETYKIVEGKLYLFYNFWGNNTLETWNERERDLRMKADKNWQKIIP